MHFNPASQCGGNIAIYVRLGEGLLIESETSPLGRTAERCHGADVLRFCVFERKNMCSLWRGNASFLAEASAVCERHVIQYSRVRV